MDTEPKEHHWKKFPASGKFSFPGMSIESAPSADTDAAHEGLGIDQHAPPQADVQRGYEDGFAEGRREGLALAQQQQQQLLDSLSAMSEELGRLRRTVIEQSLGDLVDALGILFQAMFAHELGTEPRLLQNIACQIRDAMAKEGRLQLSLSSPDYARVIPLLGEMADIELSEDAALAPGTVRGMIGRAVYEMELFRNLNDVLAAAARAMETDKIEAELMAVLNEQVAPQHGPDMDSDDSGGGQDAATD